MSLWNILNPKYLLPVVGGVVYVFEQIQKKGVVGFARVRKDPETGEMQSTFMVDEDSEFYDGVFEHARIAKEDAKAEPYVKRKRFTSYYPDGGSE